MAEQLLIRDLEIADLESLLSLYGHLHATDDALPGSCQVQELWKAIVADNSLIYLGGFIDGNLLSACNAAIIPNLTRGARPYALVENVVTDQRYRRQGIGSAVLRRLVTRCLEGDCYKVMLMSGVGRAEIHAFYEALGFDKTSKQAFIINARAKPTAIG
jgi:GNAT superfamily N-acetyltransferase